MSKPVYYVFVCVVLAMLAAPAKWLGREAEASTPAAGRLRNPNGIPLAFIQNVGQWPHDILFRADAAGATLWFTRDGIYYQFARRAERIGAHTDTGSGLSVLPPFDGEVGSVETKLIKAGFVDANPDVEIIPEGLLGRTCNYFLGDDPDGWRTNVPSYTTITLSDIYPGIDVRYEGNDRGEVEYQFTAAPGADLSRIKVTYEGGMKTKPNGRGTLLVDANSGVELETISAGEALSGTASPISSAAVWSCNDSELVSQSTGEAQSRGHTLTYSTFLGGDGWDQGNGLAVDASGCVYVVGETQSADFPTQNPFDGSYHVAEDVFVTKLSASGGELVYSTYLGGSDLDFGYDIAVDRSGSATVTGKTLSSDFPTENALDATYHDGWDAYVTKLSPSGNTLIFSTYLNGYASDIGYGIATDDSEYIYVTGSTGSSDFPIQNAYDATYNGDQYVRDVFVTKFSPLGDELVYSTFLGGEGTEFGQDVAVDDSGCAYVTGAVSSADFPTMNAYDSSQAGPFDVFVTKFSSSGSELVYSTFIGGSDYDFGYGIAVDALGCVYATGITTSPDFPTLGAFDSTYNDGDGDAFVTKLSASGSTLIYSTYLGSSGTDYGRSIALDYMESAYVTGYTHGSDFPTQDGYDGSHNGYSDVFVTKLSASGNTVWYSTFLGGPDQDYGNGIAVDGSMCAYVTGYTSSPAFPTTNGYDATYNGHRDVFVTKFSGLPEPVACGNADSSGPVDIDDIVYLLNYIFGGGPEPFYYLAADVDCSEAVDIDDAVFLVNYIFSGGPDPCDPDNDGAPECMLEL